jgi:Ca-activated chloride channel family protein
MTAVLDVRHLVLFLLLAPPAWAARTPWSDASDPRASDACDGGGRMEARVGGRSVAFPTLKLDFDVDVRGDLAEVTVVQTFANPAEEPVHATYLFPLSENAAVHAMEMRVEDEVVRAVIQRVEEARATFEAARDEGRSAALLTQHRPNMFTQDVANLAPGLPVTVTLSYVEPLRRADGAYRLVLPLVVGPRYQPTGAGVPSALDVHSDSPSVTAATEVAGGAVHADSARVFGEWELEELPAQPPYADVDVPPLADEGRVSLRVRLACGMPIRAVECRTHDVTVARPAPDAAIVELASGAVLDDRDFVLTYTLAGERPQAGFVSHADGRGGFFSLLVEPPSPEAEAPVDVTPREMVFVLDCSGSMAGMPLGACKAFMREAFATLRPTDTFRVIRFSDAATEYSRAPVPAGPDEVADALDYVDSLRGEGGTEMSRGIRQALEVPVPEGAVRLVVFLTDGYIGNEHEVMRLVHSTLGPARLFALGVGEAPNRWLLEELARVGRGFARFIDPTDTIEGVAQELATRLQSPVLTDIRIDWGTLAPVDVFPSRIPDLFAGQSVRVVGRLAVGGSHEIAVEGRAGGLAARLPLRVQVAARERDGGEALPISWARAAVADAMADLAVPPGIRDAAVSDADLKARVVELGLEHHLVTQWTAFVAVSERVVNDRPEEALASAVPLPRVHGTPDSAYGCAPSLAPGTPGRGCSAPRLAAASSPTVTGPNGLLGSLFATPEPPASACLVLVLALAALASCWVRR